MIKYMLSTAAISATIAVFSFGSLAYAQKDPVKPEPVKTEPAKAEPAKIDATRDGVDAEATSTSASFGDWVMRCQRTGSGIDMQRVCEVAQQIRAKDQQEPVAELAIGRLKKNEPLHLTLVLPVNVALPDAPSFSADSDKPEPLDLGWRKCLAGGCFADAIVKDDMLHRWRSLTSPGRITWKDASGREIAIGVSFRGLAQALDALNKESMS